jgi:energy-coupling factor transporter ATP-binding protein EcfA2
MPAVIDFQQVSFTYAGAANPALREITLAVPAGQICAVIGRAGAGKSTLCALAAGFVPNFFHGQVSGTALVAGQDVFAQPVSELVRYVALVGGNASGQISGACDTVYEEVGFTLQNLGMPRPEMIERIDWALSALQISHLRDRSPYELSGGQQQRMVIAAALALRPPVLVLDEPTAQLDPLAVEELAELLRSLAAAGTTMLIAEHRLEWVAALAERVVALDTGAIVADGPPQAVLTDPQLVQRRIGWPRPALFAEQARKAGYWPDGTPIPVTLEQLVEGLRRPAPAAPTGGPDGVAPAPAPAFTSPRPDAARPEGGPILEIDQVTFSYPSGVQALRGVSLGVGRGERVALLGRNGAGKSTLVRHMNGLLQPSSGQVLVAGRDTRSTSVAANARHVGIVFQDVRNQLFARSVREELRFGPRNLGRSPAEIEALVEQSLAALDLTEVADTHPYDLPPARRRLVAIAAVLAMDSELLVLDEPTAGLDNAGIALLAGLIYDRARAGKSVVVVSHDLDFCFETLERIVLLRDGQKLIDAPATQLTEDRRAELEQTVGLPIGLRAAAALGLRDADPYLQLLLPALMAPGSRSDQP